MSEMHVDPLIAIPLNVEPETPIEISQIEQDRIIEAVSPTATVEPVEGGAMITVTDKNGETYTTLYNGIDGNGIESVSMNADYTLTIIMTNGESYTTDSIRGEQGPEGPQGPPGTGGVDGVTVNGTTHEPDTDGIVDIGDLVEANQGAANAGKALGIDVDGSVIPVPFSGDDFTGATASSAGVHGYVPAPAISERKKFLCGDGTWDDPESSKLVVFELDTVTNTSGSYTHTTVLSSVTHDMKPVMIECDNPDAFQSLIHVTTADGGITLTCDNVSGTSEVTVSCMFVANADPLTSSEFDVLANRIGTLADLDTTDKSDLVSAVNEVVGDIATVNDSLATKERYIYLTVNDDTWAKVWAKISLLSTGHTATFFANATPFTVINGGARTSVPASGTITRTSSTSFRFVLNVGTGSNNIAVFANITGVSASSAGTYAEKGFDDYIVTELVQFDSVAIAANSNQAFTKDISKTGYKPIGIARLTVSTGGLVPFEWTFNSAGTSVTVRLRNATESSLTGNPNAYILWVKS